MLTDETSKLYTLFVCVCVSNICTDTCAINHVKALLNRYMYNYSTCEILCKTTIENSRGFDGRGQY